jgi:flagellar biosynthesis GTPase FlhF
VSEKLPEQERIGKEKIPEALAALRALNAKELPDVPAKVAIRKMRRQIERVLRLGYTYDEVSSVLAGLDIHIGGSRLKYLLAEVRKSTRSQNKKKAEHLEESETEQVNSAPQESELTDSHPELATSEPLKIEKKKHKEQKILKPQSHREELQKQKDLTQTQIKQKQQQQESLRFEPKFYNDDDL